MQVIYQHQSVRPTLLDTIHMATLKLADALWETAQAIRTIAAKAGMQITISQVYNDDTAQTLALISGLLRQAAERATNVKIEIEAP